MTLRDSNLFYILKVSNPSSTPYNATNLSPLHDVLPWPVTQISIIRMSLCGTRTNTQPQEKLTLSQPPQGALVCRIRNSKAENQAFFSNLLLANVEGPNICGFCLSCRFFSPFFWKRASVRPGIQEGSRKRFHELNAMYMSKFRKRQENFKSRVEKLSKENLF